MPSDMNKKIIFVMPIFIGFVVGWIMMPTIREILPINIPIPDIVCGLILGCVLKLAQYMKSKDAKKYRHNVEYGSARWGTPNDIKPFIDRNPNNNIILTSTESMTMNARSKNPEHNRNKNILVIGGSGSGKTRFFVKPNLMQCDSTDYPVSFVVTDPKGTVMIETGKMLVEKGYEIITLNTVDFEKSNKYNPFAYIRGKNDKETQANILTFVTVLIASTKSEGAKGGDEFWTNAERLLYLAIIGYIIYVIDDEADKNINTMVDLINMMEASEDDESHECTVTILFRKLEEENRPNDCPTHFALNNFRSYKQAAGKTAKSILISCAARLAPFTIKAVREAIQF